MKELRKKTSIHAKDNRCAKRYYVEKGEVQTNKEKLSSIREEPGGEGGKTLKKEEGFSRAPAGIKTRENFSG